MNRRGFLKIAGVAGAGFVLGVAPGATAKEWSTDDLSDHFLAIPDGDEVWQRFSVPRCAGQKPHGFAYQILTRRDGGIEEAIKGAAPGGTIYVHDGDGASPLIVHDRLYVPSGLDGLTIDGINESGFITLSEPIEVHSKNVTIKGLNVLCDHEGALVSSDVVDSTTTITGCYFDCNGPWTDKKLVGFQQLS
jgi:hypothetical protein